MSCVGISAVNLLLLMWVGTDSFSLIVLGASFERELLIMNGLFVDLLVWFFFSLKSELEYDTVLGSFVVDPRVVSINADIFLLFQSSINNLLLLILVVY